MCWLTALFATVYLLYHWGFKWIKIWVWIVRSRNSMHICLGPTLRNHYVFCWWNRLKTVKLRDKACLLFGRHEDSYLSRSSGILPCSVNAIIRIHNSRNIKNMRILQWHHSLFILAERFELQSSQLKEQKIFYQINWSANKSPQQLIDWHLRQSV